MQDIGKQLAAINHAIKRRIEKETKCDLMRFSVSNGNILMYLHEHKDEDVFQKNIEEAFGITRSSASKVISLMETKGLIERRSVSGDARLKKLIITELGENVRQKMIEGRDRMEKRLTKDFSEEEKEQLSRFLLKLRANLEEKGE
ncbi:MAG: MarR family transcriptional regulator [Firmicutes bacterium]|nr:MarR family transcriptional regulator [Bacillota bacterium]